jgi:glycosyltransferase involved in cell wall biosynthesis
LKAFKIAILTSEKREHDKDYANPAPCFGTAPTALLAGLAMLPEAEVHVVSCVQQPVNSPEKIAPNIFYHSLVVPKAGWLRTGYLGCIRAVRKKLKAIRPDIVHGQGTERDCAISAVFSGFPNVLTLHGNMRLVAAVNGARPFSFLWLAARLEKFTLPHTDGVVCITRYTRTAVAKLARRTWVLPNAVDAGFFDVRPAPAPDQPPVVLCVGAVCRRKNQNAFIRALDPLAAQKKFSAVFVGELDGGAYGEEFSRLVKERPWCRHVPFSGRDRVKEFFQAATLVALPTLEDNCPMVVLEAMAAGVPVLASNVGGVPDLIGPEKTGLFCDPRQPESFSAGVARLLDDRDFGRQLAARARLQARERFHPQVVARRHLEIYREVLSKTCA